MGNLTGDETSLISGSSESVLDDLGQQCFKEGGYRFYVLGG